VEGSDPYKIGYSSAGAAATGGVSFYCGLPANITWFTTCQFASMDASGNVWIATNRGTFTIFYVYEYWACPKDTQSYPTWTDNGITYTPACVNWTAAPPPPPPPPPPPIPVVIDPGHGFSCPAKGMAIGAVGVTDFPTSDPPAGRSREDELTMAISLEVKRQLPPTKYRVVLTKASVNTCPTFIQRGFFAAYTSAKAFVSVHINAPNLILGSIPSPIANGTSVFYNRGKSGSFNLAEALARSVSASLGVNNRGVFVNDDLEVLKRTGDVAAVLLETARLSGSDEVILHSSASVARAAAGIRAAIELSVGN
jgi:N-acetylmuramoyl-L-alanine amidase